MTTNTDKLLSILTGILITVNAALYICLGLPDRRHLLLASYQQQ